MVRQLRAPVAVQDFHKVWSDDSVHLTLWEPVPPAGYCALGYVATTDYRKPPAFSAFCVRDDATHFSDAKPLVAAQLQTGLNDLGPQGRTSLTLCSYDPSTLALTKRAPGTEGTPQFILSLPAPTEGRAPSRRDSIGSASGGASPPLTLHLGTSSMCVRVRNILRAPLLELETAGIDAECEVHQDGGARATLNFSPEVWSYNAALKEWEPMVEKFPVRVCC